MEAASAIAQAVRSKVLSLGDFVARRKKSTRQPKKDYMGWVYSLPEKEQEALVEAGRISVKELRYIDDRSEHEALDEYHKVYAPALTQGSECIKHTHKTQLGTLLVPIAMHILMAGTSQDQRA